jgi:uncharacterized glyoxalase superfamily protein PhnB
MTAMWPTLTVKDVDASLEFYSENLGLRRDLAEKDSGGTTFLGSVEVGDTVIMFESQGPNVSLDTDHGARSGVTLTVCLSSQDDIDAMYHRLLENRVRVCSAIGNRPWGNRDFTVQDPDGYRVIIAQQITTPTREP